MMIFMVILSSLRPANVLCCHIRNTKKKYMIDDVLKLVDERKKL